MVNMVKGNIINCKEGIIVHQVNVQGIMGGGLARQLADRYTGLEKQYYEFCKNYKNDYMQLAGRVNYFIKTDDGKVIANIFSQLPMFYTDLTAMKVCLNKVKEFAIRQNNDSIAIPYGIGCGIAKGKWEAVYKIIQEVFKDYDVTIYKLEKGVTNG